MLVDVCPSGGRKEEVKCWIIKKDECYFTDKSDMHSMHLFAHFYLLLVVVVVVDRWI
jgi:hypothetical protein